jgi:hypothetical protein
MLHHITRLAKRYRESPELGWGDTTIIDTELPHVLVHTTTWEDRSMVLLHNLASEPAIVPFTLEGMEPGTELVDLLSEESCELDADSSTRIPMDGYGYRWLRVAAQGDHRLL